jgi:phosphoribosylanthranilate isomerase
MRVKICGINSPTALDGAAEAGADWIGFVFFPPSPRHVTPAKAAALSCRLANGPLRVGLFVDPADDDVAAAMNALHLDVLQLYARPDRIADIATRFQVPVWRSVPVATQADLPAALGAETAVLIEPKAPAGATRPGGNASILDVSVLSDWSPDFNWLLAGGLRPDNVAEAIRSTRACAVDVSSGVESAPGVKDPGLIRAFIAAARSA